MTLENLLKIGLIKRHPADASEVRRLLLAAKRNLRDAEVTAISHETRFDAAYKAIMQSALAALMAHGYRPDTNQPGHHQTLIQGLSLTIELPPARIGVLDAIRRRRNMADYTGEEVDESLTEAATCVAGRLLDDVAVWLEAHRPELIARDDD